MFWRWEMKIFGDYFCFFAIFYSFFCKNDEKLAYVFGVRACLIDFAIEQWRVDAEGALKRKLMVETAEFGLGSLSLRDYDATSGGILFVFGRSNSDSDEHVR